MSTVEAFCPSGVSMLLEDCETVGDVMAKVAILRKRLATHIVVINPANGQQMAANEAITPQQKVEFVILSEEYVEMDIKSWKLNLRLHARQSDDATCSLILDKLSMPGVDNIAAQCALRDLLRNSNLGAAQTLLRLGVSGDMALRFAVAVGRADIVQFLVDGDNNSEVGWAPDIATALLRACETNHIHVIQVLLRAETAVKSKRKYGDTALIIASARGCAGTVRILLNASADINDKGECESTALIKAAARGHEHVVQILLDAGANVPARKNEAQSSWLPSQDL